MNINDLNAEINKYMTEDKESNIETINVQTNECEKCSEKDDEIVGILQQCTSLE